MSIAIEEATAIQALAILERFRNAVNNHDMQAFGGLFAPDAVLIVPVAAAPIRGRDAIQDFEASLTAAFPNAVLTLHNPVAHGDSVAVEWEWGGKNTGEFKTPMRVIPATNRDIHFEGASFLHIQNGLITRERRYYDTRTILQQLGLLRSLLMFLRRRTPRRNP
jgi:steroid delta-isomerase-like uncharacterized protein